jgi:omega-amidase
VINQMKTYAFQTDILWEDKEANFRKIEQLTDQTSPVEGSLLVLPEMFATGFSMNAPLTQEPPDGPTNAFLRKWASETKCHVLAGLTQSQTSGKPTNEAMLLTPDGEIAGRYQKIHPFSMGKEGEHYAAGESIQCFELPGGLRICPFICYDLRFPEIFRKAMLREQAPHAFIVIANWPNKRTMHWSRLLEARAIENLAYVVGLNRCGSDPYLGYDGASAIMDPHGATIAKADAEECVIESEINMQIVDEWRQTFPALKDRRDFTH